MTKPTEIECPLCGATVKLVASATLSLALWQHVNWVCKELSFSGRTAGCLPADGGSIPPSSAKQLDKQTELR